MATLETTMSNDPLHHDDEDPTSKTGTSAQVVDAIRVEHQLTFNEALRLYPKAIGWSAFVSIGVIMLAFDPQLLGNLYSTPQFARDFGYEYNGEVSENSSKNTCLIRCYEMFGFANG